MSFFEDERMLSGTCEWPFRNDCICSLRSIVLNEARNPINIPVSFLKVVFCKAAFLRFADGSWKTL